MTSLRRIKEGANYLYFRYMKKIIRVNSWRRFFANDIHFYFLACYLAFYFRPKGQAACRAAARQIGVCFRPFFYYTLGNAA
jgi:hypothetical protein